MVLVKTDVKEMYSKNQMVVFIIMELLVNELLIDIVLILKNGLKIKILFAGMEDYLNIKIMFLLVDILILVYYMNMILIKNGCLNLQELLIVLK
jgi:hypothetical protein